MSRPISNIVPPPSWTRLTTVLEVETLTESRVILIKCSEENVSLQLFADGTIRLRAQRPFAESLPPGLLDLTAFDAVTPDIESTTSGWRLTHENTVVTINRDPLQVTLYHNDEPVWSTMAGGMGFRQDSVWCQVPLQRNTHLYGLGEKVGTLNKRPGRWTQWTTDRFLHVPSADPLYIAIPFAILSNETTRTGIFLANAHRSYFDADISQLNVLTLGADGGELDLFIFPGSLTEILNRYTALTGRTPLPPLYALGFQQSRYSYATDTEVRDITHQFRKYRIPCDAIYLDIDYMQGYRVFTWDSTRFPTPLTLVSDLKEEGFAVIPIVDPGVKVDPNYSVYQQGNHDNHFLAYANGEEFHSQVWPGMCAFPDFLRPETRDWWGNQHETLTAAGVTGIWNDMNEPAWNRGGPGSYGHDNDADVVHHDGMGTRYSHSAVHNLYAFYEAQATFEALRNKLQIPSSDGKVTHGRPFVLTRSGFAGIQRYAAVWTGDNCSWWEHMAMAIPMCLNLGLSGVAFSGPDAGGFQHNATPELYARWIQMAAFFPFFRAHTAKNTAHHEPWSFGPDVLAIARQYIEYRYRFLPYLYSLFYQTYRTGTPAMRPLLWEFPEDTMVLDIDDQFLLGSGLMVAPVTRPNSRERRVYLPAGHWFDFWTHEDLVGPSSRIVDCPLETLPLFIRSGSVIPLGPKVLSTAYLPAQDLAMGTDGPREFFIARGNGQFVVYSDDGKTDRYQEGAYRTIQVTVKSDGSTTYVTWEALHWPSMAAPLKGNYLVHIGYYERPPHRIRNDSQELEQVDTSPGPGQWTWDSAERRISVVLTATPIPHRSANLIIESRENPL